MRPGDHGFGSRLIKIIGAAGLASLILSAFLLVLLEHDNPKEDRILVSHEYTPNDWPFPFVHVVNTRFMQHQGNLTQLAEARLILFENFCLVSMINQSLLRFGQNLAPFLWIIKVDPDLNEIVLQKLLVLVNSYPFAYVVASNVNYGIGVHPGGWRGGEAGRDVLNSRIYSGDVKWLRIAHESRNSRAILETRLDADDGLHCTYLEMIQRAASEKLRCDERYPHPSRQKWMYWCPMNRLEWNPSPPLSTLSEYGIFLPIKSPHACITAGITLGVSIGVEETHISRFPHQSLYQQLGASRNNASCGGDKCLDLLPEPMLGAIRSRTLTSAGMKGVSAHEADFASNVQHDVGSNPAIWELLLKDFHVTREGTSKANRYLQTHFTEVVEDNLAGQCTHGHSCKNSTKEALRALLRDQNGGNR